MQKPQAQNVQVYNFLTIASYVSEKYHLHLHDMDLWHWFVDKYEPDNGTQINFNTTIYSEDEDWVKEMKKYIEIEFGQNITLLVEW